MDSKVFGPEHYGARASELEAAGKRISDLNIRTSYLELARSLRKWQTWRVSRRVPPKSMSSRLRGSRLTA
jgi:hypothetical protein